MDLAIHPTFFGAFSFRNLTSVVKLPTCFTSMNFTGNPRCCWLVAKKDDSTQGCNDGFSPRDVDGIPTAAPASRRRRRSLKSEGGSMLIHPFVSFPFISFSLCFASLCFVSFGHSLTHQFVSSFVRSSQSLNCCCLVIAIVSRDFHYLLSMANSDMIWGSENSDYCVCVLIVFTMLHKFNKHPTTLKHEIGNFNI